MDPAAEAEDGITSPRHFSPRSSSTSTKNDSITGSSDSLLAHAGKGTETRLTEVEAWKIFTHIDVAKIGRLYISEITRALELLDEDKVYEEGEVNYLMVRLFVRWKSCRCFSGTLWTKFPVRRQ